MLKKIDTDYLKGVGILLIMLHNVFHLMNNAPGENEYSFSFEYTYHFAYNILHTPGDILKQFFSFFGHYGVQIFIFLSAYGLTVKYGNQSINYASFIKKRIAKLYPVFLGAVVLFLLITFRKILMGKMVLDVVPFIKSLALKLTFTSNLIPGEALSLCGPWWFFSLIVQLYLLYPILIKLKNKHLLFIVFAVWLIQLIIIIFTPGSIDYLRINSIGHLPEFITGIYLARIKIHRIKFYHFVIALLIFISGCINKFCWVFSFFSVPVMAIYLYRFVEHDGKSYLQKFIIFMGRNSLYLFAVHGFLRPPFIALGNKSIPLSAVSAVAFVLFSILAAIFLKYLVTKIIKPNK